jgi:hypothetical protein
MKLLGHQVEANDAKRRKLIAIEKGEARTSQNQEQESQKCKQKVIAHFVLSISDTIFSSYNPVWNIINERWEIQLQKGLFVRQHII